MQVQGSRDTARDSGLRVQSQNSTFSCDLGIRRQEFAADRSSAAQLMTTMEHVRSVLRVDFTSKMLQKEDQGALILSL